MHDQADPHVGEFVEQLVDALLEDGVPSETIRGVLVDVATEMAIRDDDNVRAVWQLLGQVARQARVVKSVGFESPF